MCMPWNHKFGEPNFEQLSQQCTKCGKVTRIAPKPCTHKWEIIKETIYVKVWENLTNDEGILYALQCTNCGDLKEERMETLG